MVAPLKLALPVASVHRNELAPEYRYQEVARSTGWFEESRVDSLGLRADQIQHLLHEP
jgi:hypothetical protein